MFLSRCWLKEKVTNGWHPMNRTSVLLLAIALAVPSCKEQAGFYDPPEIVEELIERMESGEDIGLELSVSVEPSGPDSVRIQYYLTNTKATADTLSTSSSFPTRIAYRYGQELTFSFERLIFVQDQRTFSVLAGESFLLNEWHVKRVSPDDHLIRGIFRFSFYNYEDNYMSEDYWLVSEPVLIKGEGN